MDQIGLKRNNLNDQYRPKTDQIDLNWTKKAKVNVTKIDHKIDIKWNKNRSRN